MGALMNVDEVLARVDACLSRLPVRNDGAPRLFVGIGGGSASGKTTLAEDLARTLLPIRATVIHQDRFFKPNEEKPRYFSKTYGGYRPDYNRPDSFREEEMTAFCRGVSDTDVVILEGILSLHFPILRSLMDLKLFVHADPDERIVRRIRRNLPRSSFDEITLYYLESVRHRHLEFCEPTRVFADAVIDGGMASDDLRRLVIEGMCSRICRRLSDFPG